MEWRDQKGRPWELAPPTTTLEVMEAEGVATLALKREVATDAPISLQALTRTRDWLVSRVTASPLEGWGAWCVRERELAWDEEVSLSVWVDCYQALMREAGLDADTQEAIAGIIRVGLEGGCECRSCKDRGEAKAGECLLAEYPAHAHHLLSLWLPVREDALLHAPYWLHQVKTIWASERGEQALRERARREEEKAKEAERERCHNRLRRGGHL